MGYKFQEGGLFLVMPCDSGILYIVASGRALLFLGNTF